MLRLPACAVRQAARRHCAVRPVPGQVGLSTHCEHGVISMLFGQADPGWLSGQAPGIVFGCHGTTLRGQRHQVRCRQQLPGAQRTDWLPGGAREGSRRSYPALATHVRQVRTLSQAQNPDLDLDSNLPLLNSRSSWNRLHRLTNTPCMRRQQQIGACTAAGLRVLKPGAKWWPSWADCYNNLRWVPQIQCPVIVLHVHPVPDPASDTEADPYPTLSLSPTVVPALPALPARR